MPRELPIPTMRALVIMWPHCRYGGSATQAVGQQANDCGQRPALSGSEAAARWNRSLASQGLRRAGVREFEHRRKPLVEQETRAAEQERQRILTITGLES